MNCVQINECRCLSVRIETVCVRVCWFRCNACVSVKWIICCIMFQNRSIDGIRDPKAKVRKNPHYAEYGSIQLKRNDVIEWKKKKKNNYNYVLSIYKQSMCSTVKTKVVCADNSDIFHWDLIASRTQHTTQWLNIHSLLLDILTHIHQYPGNIQMIGKWNINIIIWTFHSMVDMCGSNTFLKVLEIWVTAHRSIYTMDETLFPATYFFRSLSLSLC